MAQPVDVKPIALEIPETLPILVLRSAVLFPSGVIGLQVATERSLRLVESLPQAGCLVAIFSARSGESEPTSSDDFAKVGVAAEVVQVLRLGEDRQQLFLHGLQRVALVSLESSEPFYLGRVQKVKPRRVATALEGDVLIGKALAAFESLAVADDRYSSETVELLRMNVDQGAELFSDLLATYLNVAVEEKQRLVETTSAGERLRLLVELVEQELARVAVDRDIQTRVRTEIEEKKREYLLREQLRIIRQALGEDRGPEREAEDFRTKIDHLPLDDESKRALKSEANRLSVLSEQSAEYPVLHSYFETVFALPWKDRSKDSLSLQKVERTLDKNHYGVGEVKERILEYLAVANLKGNLAGPILCLSGPPGTGKTSLARSIADALGRRFIPLSLGGVSDESDIRGHRKTYVGAMPGKLIAAYQRVGTKNPVILLDEIDKLDSNFRGDPAAALLEVLDPEQNRAFVDRYLGIPFDLSETLFIATANRLDTIPGPLRDRMEIIQLPGYTEEEKLEIAKRYLVKRQLEANGLASADPAIENVKITDEALRAIIREYTREAGVRNLEREIGSVFRSAAMRIAEGGAEKIVITEKDLAPILGPRKFESEVAERTSVPGVATGLAWTSVGGDILFIEASKVPGSGKLILTGQLGDVMKESAQAALTLARNYLGDAFDKVDLHIHVPAGATPKDGPSAGVAMFLALVSLLSGKPVRHDVAMTGEISLRGLVLPIGGVKEKTLAALRAGIKCVMLPKRNEKDLEDVPAEARAKLHFAFLEHVDDAVRTAIGELPKAGDRKAA